MILKVQFQNYKQIKALTAELQSGNLYFVKGSNNIGKTSFLQGLLTTLKGKSNNKSAVTFGESEGSIQTQVVKFKGADGQNYSIRYDLAEGKDDKFTIVRPDTTVSRKGSDIANIFQYNAFTVDEFFAWGTNAEGRRKQAQVILNLLPKAVQAELAELDAQVNTRNGTLFEARKAAKAVWEHKKALCDSILYDVHETQAMDLEDYVADTDAMLQKREQAVQDRIAASAVLVQQATLQAAIQTGHQYQEQAFKNYTAFTEAQFLRSEQLKAEMEKCKAELLTLQTNMEKENLQYEQEQYALEQKLLAETLSLKAVTAALEAKKLVDVDALDKSLAIRKVYVDMYHAVKAKQQAHALLQEEVEQARQQTENLTTTLESLRTHKQELMASTALPVDNLVLDGDEIFWQSETGQLLPFSEENISYAVGGLAVAKLMLAVNKDLPLLLVGKAAEYDNASLHAISMLAETNDAIVILDRVLPETTELQIECYQQSLPQTDTPTAPVLTKMDIVSLSHELGEKPFDL